MHRDLRSRAARLHMLTEHRWDSSHISVCVLSHLGIHGVLAVDINQLRRSSLPNRHLLLLLQVLLLLWLLEVFLVHDLHVLLRGVLLG